jgi:glycosyltransferase involved in cell wall biosynthesis
MKILYITTISLTMNSFFKPHIDMLVREGHHVDIACNCTDLALDPLYKELNCISYQIDFSRSPMSPDNIRAYKQLKQVITNGSYDIVHCHTPNASVITRLVCRKLRRKTGLKVFYTAHGFHFYKDAPKLNWLFFYPIEKICSQYTDKLITINREDYELAKKKFKAKEIHYVPGVGVELSEFKNVKIDRNAKRREIGVPEGAFLLFSVGELNDNKNHRVIINALAGLRDPNVHYAIAGVGDKKEYLLALAEELGVSEQVHLLGYRKDIPELNHASDVFCFPSRREGLGLAAIEAMACELPVIAAKNRGTNEFVYPGQNGFFCEYSDVDAFASSLNKVIRDRTLLERFSQNTYNAVERFELGNVLNVMKEMYG